MTGLSLRVAICNHSVQADFVQVRGFQLQHLVNAIAVDGIGGFADLLGGFIAATKASLDQLLAVLVQQVECWFVCARRDLDELRKPISDLRSRKRTQEREVEECVDRSVVGTETVLVVTIVDSNLD